MSIRDILARVPVVPLLLVDDPRHAAPLARALYAGGLTVLEVTLRSPRALQAIEAMRAAVPDAIVGAGTLMEPDDIQRVHSAGAQFAVTPGLTPALITAATGAALPLLPGVMTASEIMVAREAGYRTMKFFPAQPSGGVAMLQAFAGPFPDIAFCPSGGITRENACDYLHLANVVCVGGPWLAPPALIQRGDWSRIEQLAREVVSLPRACLSLTERGVRRVS